MKEKLVLIQQSYKRHWLALFLLIAFYSIVFAWFYPPIHGIEDEAGYINLAYIWTHGDLTQQTDGNVRLADFEEHDGRSYSWRSPGRAVAIFPFLILFGGNSVFISGALIHLVTVLIAAWLLQKLDQSPLWAVLLLFHPTLILYSRTVMSDELAGCLLLLAVAACASKRYAGIGAGVAIGLAAFVRLHAALVTPFIALALWFSGKKKDALWCLASAGVFGILISIYNYLAVGGSNLYGNHAQFGIEFLPDRLQFYLPALLLIYPLQLLAPFADNSPLRFFTRAICLPLLILLSFYFWHDSGSNFAQTLIVGQRLLMIALPVWIVSYALMLARVWQFLENKFVPRRLLISLASVVGVFLLIAQIGIFQTHQKHLLNYKNAQDEIAKIVPENSLVIANRNITKLLGTPAMGAPKYDWLVYQFLGVPYNYSDKLAQTKKTWYLVLLPKNPDDVLPETLNKYVRQYQMTKIETQNPQLIVYRAEPEKHLGE